MDPNDRGILQVTHVQVRDESAFRRYAGRALELTIAHGAELIAMSTPDVVEGGAELAGFWLVHRWRSRSAFDSFYGSAVYGEILPLRHAAADTTIVLVESTSD